MEKRRATCSSSRIDNYADEITGYTSVDV